MNPELLHGIAHCDDRLEKMSLQISQALQGVFHLDSGWYNGHYHNKHDGTWTSGALASRGPGATSLLATFRETQHRHIDAYQHHAHRDPQQDTGDKILPVTPAQIIVQSQHGNSHQQQHDSV